MTGVEENRRWNWRPLFGSRWIHSARGIFKEDHRNTALPTCQPPSSAFGLDERTGPLPAGPEPEC